MGREALGWEVEGWLDGEGLEGIVKIVRERPIGRVQPTSYPFAYVPFKGAEWLCVCVCVCACVCAWVVG
jgi:hypothetical protein